MLSRGGRSLAPTGRELLAMALVGFALRAILALASFRAFDLCHPDCSQRASGQGLMHKAHDYAVRADGKSYMAYARAIRGDVTMITAADMRFDAAGRRLDLEAVGRDTSKFEDYDKRVFPGFPMVLALAQGVGLPLPIAALFIPWLCSGIAAALAGLLFADRRIGWAMAFLVPHYVLYTSMAMTESVLLAFILGGLVLIMRSNLALAGGLLLGFAGLVRPNACFAVAGVVTYLAWRRNWRDVVMTIGGTGLVFFGGMLAIQLRMGDVLQSVSVYKDHPYAYKGELLTWPFKSLIMTPLQGNPRPPLWKTAYVWLHVLAALAACWLAFRGMLKARRGAATHDNSMDVLSAPWAIGNTLFILCVGHIWGFHAFPRFTTWAMPAMFWPLRGILPTKFWIWIPIGIVSMVIAMGSVMKN